MSSSTATYTPEKYPTSFYKAIAASYDTTGLVKHHSSLLSSSSSSSNSSSSSSSWANVTPIVMDAQSLLFPDNTFDASFTMFGIFFFAEKGTREIYRTLKKGGYTVVSMWRRVDWYPILQEARRKIVLRTGKEEEEEEGKGFTIPMLEKWQTPGLSEETLRKGGFDGEEAQSVRTYEGSGD
ncbi:hypothetical protein MMC14_007985 [Varicellaria rhodocarpa]|nr:hypothetical protein [Varicellaria rhodocarpa]